jgi:hypothetical protein
VGGGSSLEKLNVFKTLKRVIAAIKAHSALVASPAFPFGKLATTLDPRPRALCVSLDPILSRIKPINLSAGCGIAAAVNKQSVITHAAQEGELFAVSLPPCESCNAIKLVPLTAFKKQVMNKSLVFNCL